jgi:hypothetical protein
MADEAFEPTAELRYLRPPATTTKPDRLQQLWRRPRMDTWGHLAGWDEEWRDVPLVIGENASDADLPTADDVRGILRDDWKPRK